MLHTSSISAAKILVLFTCFLLSACQQKSVASFSKQPTAPPPQTAQETLDVDRIAAAATAPAPFQDAA